MAPETGRRPRPPSVTFFVAALAAVLAGMVHPVADAARWVVDSSVSAGGGYADNTRKNAKPRSTGWRGNLAPRTSFSVTTPRSSLSGSAAYNFNRFSEAENTDEDSRLFSLSAAHRTAYQRWAISGRLSSTNIIRNRFEETGIVFADTTRDLKFVQPSWTWNIGAKDRLSLSANYRKTSYDNQEDTGLRDFTSKGTTAALVHRLSPLSNLTGSVSWSTFSFDNDSDETDSLSANLVLSHSFSPKLSVTLSAGQRRTTTIRVSQTPVGVIIDNVLTFTGFATVETESDNTGSIYSASVQRKFARGLLSASASRSLGISGSRGVVLIDTAGVAATREISPRWSLAANGGLSETKNTDDEQSSTNRSIARAGLTLRWKARRNHTISINSRYSKQKPLDDDSQTDQITRFEQGLVSSWQLARDWKLNAIYRYSTRSSDEQSRDERVHSVGLTVTYSWPTITFSP